MKEFEAVVESLTAVTLLTSTFAVFLYIMWKAAQP